VTTTDTGDIVSSSSTFSVTNAANKSVYLPPVFIGFSIEIALPDLFNPGKYIGFGLSGGFIADADNNLDFFLTEKTLQNIKTPALQAAAGCEFGILIPAADKYINNNDVAGSGTEASGGIGFVGGSYGQNSDRTYHQIEINGPGISLEAGFANWNTSTNTMRLYN